MFENLRQSIRDLASGVIPPAQRGAAIAEMRATLVQARVGVADLAAALEKTRGALGAEEKELATVQRRREQAQRINDAETVEIALRFENKHAGRVSLLQRKIAVQEEELRLAEAEVATMVAELKTAMAGAGSASQSDATSAAAAAALDEAEDLRRDLDALARRKQREEKEAVAEERLAELKRRMGRQG
jgi:hypothetical protein